MKRGPLLAVAGLLGGCGRVDFHDRPDAAANADAGDANGGGVDCWPVPIPGAGTNAVEGDPELSPDERVMVFGAGLPLSLHLAVRASAAVPFEPPVVLTAVVTGTGYDSDATLSPDGCELFFISDRAGDRDIYRAIVKP